MRRVLLFVFLLFVNVSLFADNIEFASNAVKEACVAKWDTNGDGELSYTEAAAVTSFVNFSVEDSEFSFDEFQYFTGVTSLSNNSFSNRENLTSIILPSSITSIGSEAFWGSKITSINLGDLSNLTTIGTQAFYNCYRLTEVTLPASITTMGSNVFANCYNIVKVVSNIAVPLPNSGDNNIIAIYNDAVLYVPTGKADLYEAAGWKESDGELQSFRVITEGNSTDPVAREGLVYGGSDIWMGGNTQGQRLIYPGTYRDGMMEYSLDGSTYSTSVPLGKDAGEYTVYYRKVGESVASTLKVTIAANSDPSVRTVNVATAGTLFTLISSGDKNIITDLTITGNLNGADLLFIREMAGSDVKGVPTDGKLQNLDLSGATIVEGGTYLNLDGQCVYLDKEKTNPLYGFNAGTYSSVANTFGENLFAGCQQLKSLKTPTSLIEIGNQVFAGSGLTSIDLNSGLTTLDPYAFWYSKLSSITIPNTVIHIGDKNSVDNPFAYIDELTSITLEAGNTRYAMAADGKLLIDTQRKAVVTALGNAAIPEGITWIGQNAFCNRPELVHYTIPNWVTQIGGNSFSQCINLKSVVISNQMTTIANSAFTDCPNLTSVTIPSSVTKIMYNAFGNTGLTEITIPSSVTSIDEEAFAHNQNLETVISYITDPFDINDDVFAKGWDLSNTTYPQTLKVPYGTKALYEAKTGWNKITNIVEMAQTSAITVTAKSYSRAYGEANTTFEFTTAGGTVTGTPSITCAATATSVVGTYPIVIAAGTITDGSVQYVNGTLTVTKAPLKISAGSYKRKQGEANPAFSVTYDGFKNNETASVLTTQPTISCAATKDSPAGTYDITVSGAVAGNYEISYVAGTLTIEAAPTPMPEPKGTTFDVDTNDSSSKEVMVTFVVKESDSSVTPTVAISDDKDASGSVTIPEAVTHNGVEYKVTEISEGAFQNNTSLTEVKIPASITSIGANAFAGCKNLQAITINIIVPINLAVISARGFTRATGDDVFEGVNKETCILYVPAGSVDQYKAAPVWKEFKHILPIKTSTGIQGVVQTDGEPFDVFNLSGQKVKSNATSLEGLPRGIYIVKGKKVIN